LNFLQNILQYTASRARWVGNMPTIPDRW